MSPNPIRSGSLRNRYTVAVLLFGIVVSWPALVHGIPDLANDAWNHASWVSLFGQQFWGGDFYPRWLSDTNAGYGSPVFFVYPPFHVFSTVLLWPLVHPHDPYGWALSGYSCGMATLLSGLFAFLWIRRWVPDSSAFVGAIIYMAAPYHLAIDLYNRGAAAEYSIFVWLPLVMISVEQVVSNSRYGVICLAITYSLCVLSHATVGACFAAVPMGYALFCSDPGSRLRSALLTATALVIGVGISCFFLLPAALDQTKSYAGTYTADWGDYHNWWLFNIRDKITEAGTEGTGIPWYLSYKMRILVITVWMLLFSVFSWWFSGRVEPAPGDGRMGSKWFGARNRRAAFYLIVTVASFFLMLESSAWIWKIVPILKLLQFPARLNTIIVLTASMLGAMAWANLETGRYRLRIAVIVLSVGGWLIADAVFARQAYSVWRHIPAERAAHTDWLMKQRMEYFGFWPRYAQALKLLDMGAFNRLVAEHPPKTAAFVAGATGAASILSWRPRLIEMAVNTTDGGRLILNHFYYEGWTAYRKNDGNPIALTYSKPDGFMELSVPPGNYAVIVQLPRDAAERQGIWITLASLGALAGLALWRRAMWRRAAVPAS